MSKQKAYLERVLANGTTAHAYLFSGPKYGGVVEAAHDFAAALLNVPLHDLRRHTDFVLLDRLRDEKTEELSREISVDEVRDFTARLYLSSQLARNVALLLNADAMNHQSQNALLKTLEEPSGKTVIILVAHEPSRLLSTILSRVVHLPFAGLPVEPASTKRDEVRAFLSSPRHERMKVATALTKGDEANREEQEAWLEHLGYALDQELGTPNQLTRPQALRGLTALLAVREALRDNANATLTFERLALAID